MIRHWGFKMQCDMCGKITEKLNLVKVESVEMSLCVDCTKYGTFVKRVKAPDKFKEKYSRTVGIVKRNEKIVSIIESFGIKIKNAREKLNLNQEDLAKKLNEKESLMQRIESGKKEPTIAMAKKLERFLQIKLVEETIDNADSDGEKRSPRTKAPLTIGDMIKLVSK